MTEKKFNPFREAIPFLGAKFGENRVIGGNRFICHCLQDVAMKLNRKQIARRVSGAKTNPHKGQLVKVNKAREHIRKCLAPHTMLEDWLKAEGHIPKNTSLYNKEVMSKVQPYRKAWLEHLANQYDNGEIKL